MTIIKVLRKQNAKIKALVGFDICNHFRRDDVLSLKTELWVSTVF